ncbi:DNA repair protein RAD9 [Gryllus bimaculatus]|nr:DNA repair protein RAD9 [Gryllus bimaculatus]
MDDSKKSDGQLGDSATLPSWIDKTLIQQAVRNAGDEKSLVVAIHVSSATVAGDNYASTVYRVKATLTDGKERSFIIKGPVPGEMMANMTKESGIFRRETIMLADIIPKMELSHVASPMLDILYFFAGSLSEDVHVHHQDLLLREYYFALKETLELLGHESPVQYLSRILPLARCEMKESTNLNILARFLDFKAKGIKIYRQIPTILNLYDDPPIIKTLSDFMQHIRNNENM